MHFEQNHREFEKGLKPPTKPATSSSSETTSKKPPKAVFKSGVSLSKCHFCPEHHYHRDCPVLKERLATMAGKEKGVNGDPATSAPAK